MSFKNMPTDCIYHMNKFLNNKEAIAFLGMRNDIDRTVVLNQFMKEGIIGKEDKRKHRIDRMFPLKFNRNERISIMRPRKFLLDHIYRDHIGSIWYESKDEIHFFCNAGLDCFDDFEHSEMDISKRKRLFDSFGSWIDDVIKIIEE